MSLVSHLMTTCYMTHDSVSTGVYTDTLKSMTDRLGTYIASRREAMGITQSQLADRAGVPRQTVNRLEQGITKLPGALVRRQLAEALGVSHLDLLVAAGELTAQEASLPDDMRSDAVRRLSPIIDRYDWQQGDIDRIARVIQSLGEMREGTFDLPDVEG